MNSRETKCVKILTDLIENEGLIGIKTSFEDEGALFNETVRLKEVCNQAKTKVTLKIGGPEAIRDLKDASIIGVKGLVAPMVESPFGLKKFIQATETYIPADVLDSLQLNVNIETITAIDNLIEIMYNNCSLRTRDLYYENMVKMYSKQAIAELAFLDASSCDQATEIVVN